MKCNCCNRNIKQSEMRLGYCFDCANAESVITEGVDMWDNKIEPLEGLTEGLNKLRYILKLYGVTNN